MCSNIPCCSILIRSASNQQSSVLDAKLKALQARNLEEQRIFEQTKQKVTELEMKLAVLQREKQDSLLQLVDAANDRVGGTVSSVKSNNTSAKISDWNSSSKDAFDGNAFSSAGDVDISDRIEKDGVDHGGYQALEEDQEVLISPAVIKSSAESLPSADSSSTKSSQLAKPVKPAKPVSNIAPSSSSVKSVTNIEPPLKNLSESDPFGELSAPQTLAAHDDPFGATTIDNTLTTTTKGPFDDNGSSDYAMTDPFGAVDATHVADPFGTSTSDGGAAANDATSATADPFGGVESIPTVGVDPFGELPAKHVDSTADPFSETGNVNAKSASPIAAVQVEIPANAAPSSDDPFDAVSVGDASTASEDDPFGATSSKIGGIADPASDPFGEASAGITEDDPFGAGNVVDSSAADPFGSVPAAAVSASDPFGASDAKTAAEGNPFDAAGAGPFLASPTAADGASAKPQNSDSGFNAFSDANAAAFEFDSANSAPFDASAFDGFDAFGDNAPADHSEKEKFSDSNPFGHEGPDPFSF